VHAIIIQIKLNVYSLQLVSKELVVFDYYVGKLSNLQISIAGLDRT
jgi:hypothetical protein